MTIRTFILATIALLAGCGPDGPPTTDTNSEAFAMPKERTAFLHRYVTFRRTYETLDFHISFQNNGSGVPGPSDWDVRLVATVPADELSAWIPSGATLSPTANTDWLKSVPTTLDLTGVREWYVESKRVVGVDRDRQIVVYRACSTPIP